MKAISEMKKTVFSLFLVLSMAFLSVFPAAAAVNKPVPALSSTELELQVSDSAQLNASLGGADVTGGLLWTSDTPSVVVVSRGTVRAVAPGMARVTATTGDGRNASCTVRVALKGIDVSSYQGAISWSDVKSSGIGFAILRDGYGDEDPENQTDSMFAANYDGAVAAGIKVGVYHVSYALTTDDAVKEANLCLSILNGRHLDYPVFLDVEPDPSNKTGQASLTNDQLSAMAAAFCSAIQNAGYQAGVYSTDDILSKRLTGSVLAPYSKWVANPDAAKPTYTGYSLWQYSQQGAVAGIAGAVDQDNSYRDYPNPAPAPMDISILSDSPASLTLTKGKTYSFKFTPNGISGTPSFQSGNAGAVRIVSSVQAGGSYFVKISAVGKGSTSLYSVLPGQKPVRRCVVTVQ